MSKNKINQNLTNTQIIDLRRNAQRCHLTHFEDGQKGPGAKQCGQPREARKGYFWYSIIFKTSNVNGKFFENSAFIFPSRELVSYHPVRDHSTITPTPAYLHLQLAISSVRNLCPEPWCFDCPKPPRGFNCLNDESNRNCAHDASFSQFGHNQFLESQKYITSA